MKKLNLVFFSLFIFACLNLSAQKDFPLAENIAVPINSAAFIKFDGVDGEATDKWIDVLSTDWGYTGKSNRTGYILDPIIVEIPDLLPKNFFNQKIDDAKIRVKTDKGSFLITLIGSVLTNGLIGERGIVGERGASKGLIGERGIVGERGASKGLIGERGVPISIKYEKIIVQFKDAKGNVKTLFNAS